MTTEDIAKIEGIETLVEADGKQISGIFCGDLLSWAMGRAKEGDAWCTVMGNANTIAVATLADCACVVLCHDSVADEAFLQKANAHDVCVFKTSLAEFEASLAIAKAMGIA